MIAHLKHDMSQESMANCSAEKTMVQIMLETADCCAGRYGTYHSVAPSAKWYLPLYNALLTKTLIIYLALPASHRDICPLNSVLRLVTRIKSDAVMTRSEWRRIATSLSKKALEYLQMHGC